MALWQARQPGYQLLVVGMGLPLGLVGVTGGYLVLGHWGPGLHFGANLAIQVGLAVVFAALAWRRWRQLAGERVSYPEVDTWRELSNGWRWLIGLVLVWLLVRWLGIVIEVVHRPLFPWDAWYAYGIQAKVWFFHPQLDSFANGWRWFEVEGLAWASGGTRHPPGIGLIQLWLLQSLGRFDDALMNLAWPAGLLCMGLVIHGVLRVAGGSLVVALAAAFSVMTLPVVNTQAILAGYGDLWIGLFMLMAVAGVFLARQRDVRWLGVTAVAVVGMLLIKETSWMWLPVLVLGAAAGWVRLRWLVLLALAAAAGFLGWLWWQGDPIRVSTLGRLGFGADGFVFPDKIGPEVWREIAMWPALLRHLLVYENWHLFWYLAPLVLIGSVWFARVDRAFVSVCVIVWGSLAVLLGFFAFSTMGNAVVQGTSVNRLLLHLAPSIGLLGGLVAARMGLLWPGLRARGRAMVISRRLWGAMLLSALVLCGGYSSWFYVGDNYRGALNPQMLAAHTGAVVQGQGRASAEGLIVSGPGRRAISVAVIPLDEPVPAGRVESIRIRLEQTGGHHDLSIGVSQLETLSGHRDAPAVWIDDLWAEIDAFDLMLTGGEVRFVVVRARGMFDPEMIIDRVELHLTRPSFAQFQGLLFGSLVNREGWTQRSINHLKPDNRPLRVSPVVAVVAWMVLTLVFWALIGRVWSTLSGLACVVVAGWLLLDAGWQLSLWQRHGQAVADYGGKPPDQRRLVEIDADVFSFVETLKSELADPMQRLVIFGGSDFTHFRARYFAVPQPVVSRRGFSPLWLRRLQPGHILAAIYLDGEFEEKTAVEQGMPAEEREVMTWAPEAIRGRDAKVVTREGGDWLKFEGQERPWLVYSAWISPMEGVWQLELILGAGQRDGLIRVEVRRRDKERSDILVQHQVYVRTSGTQKVTLPFVIGEGEDIRFRVRELNARGSTATGVRLVPKTAPEGLVAISRDGNPPYRLARRLLETDVGVAYEIF